MPRSVRHTRAHRRQSSGISHGYPVRQAGIYQVRSEIFFMIVGILRPTRAREDAYTLQRPSCPVVHYPYDFLACILPEVRITKERRISTPKVYGTNILWLQPCMWWMRKISRRPEWRSSMKTRCMQASSNVKSQTQCQRFWMLTTGNHTKKHTSPSPSSAHLRFCSDD